MSTIHNGKASAHANRLLYAIVIIAITAVIEVIGGVVSHSLALLSDAGHMVTDLIALILSWMAYKLAMKKSDSRRSYGYHRFQVLAAFVNGLTLFLIALIIILESLKRFFDPVEVNWQIMLSVAIIGLIANIIAFFILYRKDENNLNVRSAVLHIVGDLLGSIAAIVASLTIMIGNWQIADPILSVFVSLIILNGAYKVVKSSGHILLEGTPEHINPEEVKSKIIDVIPGVKDVNHMHIWSLTNEHPVMTMHVTIDKDIDHVDTVKQTKKIINDIFNIAHITIEADYEENHEDCVSLKSKNMH